MDRCASIPDEAFRLLLPPDRLDQAAADYARDGYVRIEPVFSPEIAQCLHDHLANEIEWWRAVRHNGKVSSLNPEAVAAIKGDKEKAFLAFIHHGAREGFQFLFDSLRISGLAEERQQRGLLVDRLVEGLNHPDSLATFAAITGDASGKYVSGQATRYLAGHFLTSHTDLADDADRIAAWVLNLSPRWKIRWGGLLQFHDETGDVSRALLPRFNAINLFKVPREHSVSQVTPFTGGPRYSVTGWVVR